MNIEPSDIRNSDTRDVVLDLISEVTKSGEDMEEKETRGDKTTDLKLYIVDSSEDLQGRFSEAGLDVAEDENTKKAARDFFQHVVIEEESVNEDITFLKVTTPRYERTDEAIVIDRGDALWFLTTELKEWLEDTIENVIKYLPQLERVYLPSKDLEDSMRGIVDSEIAGFTAEYHSQHKDRDATLQFHGAETGDLNTAEEAFSATPTRIEFNQKNSPTTAIQGSGSNDGFAKLESVREGSEGKAADTLLNISNEFVKRGTEQFAVNADTSWTLLEPGFVVDEFTSIELHSPERDEAEFLDEELEEEVLSKNRYQYGRWGEDTFFVYDKEHEEVFELGIESTELVLHARESTTALSLRSFCRTVLDTFDSTYSVSKEETRVKAQ
ncbi:uncharacterized protein HHUB_4188 (plasmid) [Halobacterium hubeiense]|uniref:Uncharacterized protein n=1 Tax=Halobacterium hubeiense TaxID=1407499 RepID=A0A0U5H6Y0_9EURY|nr:hypothetical protein [Halobacterium hubeiense]CQH63792.1 uncharacterized protein HHUB_4188 [Halobacterium hubeiense]